MTGTYTEREIRRQPELWHQTIALVKEKREWIREQFLDASPEEILFTGCGTSYYLSIAAAAIFAEKTGFPAKAVPASDLYLKPTSVLSPRRRTWVIGSSRSGNTTELVRALQTAERQFAVPCLGVTGNPESELARQTTTLLLPHIQEKSVVMTGSFTNLLLSLQIITAFIAEDERFLEELKHLADLGDQILAKSEEWGRLLGEDRTRDRTVYLGLGANFGLACEGMLKLKEMTQEVSEAFNPMEFRHGPISILDERWRVVLVSDRSLTSFEETLVRELKETGAEICAIGDGVATLGADRPLDLSSGLSDAARAALTVPALQWMAFYRTYQMGLNPDRPRNLNPVVLLKDRGGKSNGPPID
ncbi:SIS domain-containing protein [Salinithrix halophila]|uniref:SIS domain-containing protein n=1 Tax=Salinithrix halophila TaxID=1485204 RepID=A0ABV8JES6_9BACL